MRMRYGKWVMAVAAAGLLGMMAAGCGKTEENTTAAKEFVYVPEYQKIELENGMDAVNIMGDSIYFLTGSYDEEAQVYKQQLGVLKVGETTPEFISLPLDPNASLSGMQTDADGNLISIVTTSIYEEGNGEDEAEAVEEAGEETAETEVTEEAGEETAATATFIGGSAGDMDYQMPVSQKTELCKFSTKGEVVYSVDLTGVLDENSYVQYTAVDKDGNIYLGLEQKVIVLDKEGKELFQFEVENWINSMFATKGGEVLISYYGAENMEVHKIDVAGKKVGEAVEGLMLGNGWGNSTYVKGNETDLLFSSGNDLYTYNLGDAEAKMVLNWIDCDINSDDVRAFATLEDGRILAVTTSWNRGDGSSTTELIYLTKKKGSEVPEKKIITFGTMSLNWDIKGQIIDFNKTNQEYRIEIKEYLTDYSAENAYSLAQEQMNADIMGGKGPDMIDVTGGNLQKYAAKGILEDLYPYMDADEEIKREDYLENVLKAYETDGKLYAVSPRFYIQTVMAKTADVGERTSITPEEVMQMVDEMPEDVKLYEYANKDSILMTNTMMNMDQYVNWSTGECKFNSEEFMKALEFANKFDTEVDYNSEGPSTPELLREGKLLMVMGTISSVEEYQMYKGMFGEPFTFVGYPTTKDNGSFIGSADSLLAMNAKSENKEGVWQFIKSRMDKETLEDSDNMGFGFPILKSALEDQFKEALEEEYYEDEEGNKHKQPKTTWGFNDFSVEIYAATEEEVEAVRNLIESTDTLYQYDQQISTIITEETKAFFEGQKSAKDVVDIIQSRVQIYVNENR